MTVSEKTDLIVRPYAPDGEVAEDAVQLEAYVRQQLQGVQGTMDELIEAAHGVEDDEPELPRTGMTRFAKKPWVPSPGGVDEQGTTPEMPWYWDGEKWLPCGYGFPVFGLLLPTSALGVTGQDSYRIVDWTKEYDPANLVDTATGRFRAPFDGIWQFNCGVAFTGLDDVSTKIVQVELILRSAALNIQRRFVEKVIQSEADAVGIGLSRQAHMNEGWTAELWGQIAGMPGNGANVFGNTDGRWTNFHGHFVCPMPPVSIDI